MNSPDPGIYEGIDFDTYRSWDAINNSSLAAALKTPAHYLAYTQTAREQTEAQLFGELSHTAMLEPLTIPDRYVVMPDLTIGIEAKCPTRTNEYKERVEAFAAQHPGKQVISEEAYQAVMGMSSALTQHDRAREYMHGPEAGREVCILWRDKQTGLLCKGRIDIFCPAHRRITDYKTTQDASDFDHAVYKWGYYRQAAFYVDGVRSILGQEFEFCIVCQEKEPPYGVRAAPVSDLAIEIGRQEYRRALLKIHAAKLTNNWPGYSDPDAWEIPAWKLPTTRLVINGERFEL